MATLDCVKNPLGITPPANALAVLVGIDLLRNDEGSSLTFMCDNPDFNGAPNAKIICCGEWTGWADQTFTGDTAFAALRNAVRAYGSWMDGLLHEEMGAPRQEVAPFQETYPTPWRLADREVVDRDGCNVQDFDDDPDTVEFWRGIVDAVNNQHSSGTASTAPREGESDG